MNSWDKGDTKNGIVGPNDLNLAQRLILAGNEHGKFARQISISMDINAPRYWWSEMDQYKVGCTTNSCSTMHTLTKKPIDVSMFSIDDQTNPLLGIYINYLENQRLKFLLTKNPEDWKHLIQMMPQSFNQLRTWTANYAVLRNIYFQRRNHKLTEWRDFCKMIEDLPYGKELITLEGK
jgi:hypothetical protein